jgi:opacity protein-like surface antigen
MSEDFLPEKAFAQLHGAIPVNEFFIDYATYMGNAEGSYISSTDRNGKPVNDLDSKFEFLSGVDPTNFDLKLFGGRVGLRSRDEQFKAGISITHDYDDLRDTTSYPELFRGTRTSLIGDAERFRLGGDLSGRVGPISFEAEIIKVLYNYEAADDLDIELDRFFFYTMLGYHFSDKLFIYGSYEGGSLKFDETWTRYTVFAGAALKLTADVTAKAQYIIYHEYVDDALHLDEVVIRFLFLGFSIVL